MKKVTGRNDKPDALVIVDVQQAFTIPTKIVSGIRRYSRRFPLRVFTQFVNPPGSLFREKLDQRSCAPGSDDLCLLIEPEPKDLVIRKAGYGLKAPDIRRLKAAGLKRVEVCGVDTDACVLGVMFSLFDAGIVCHAKEDFCWSSTGLHKCGLDIIREQFPSPR
jgi:nicotinamidase-related amidase